MKNIGSMSYLTKVFLIFVVILVVSLCFTLISMEQSNTTNNQTCPGDGYPNPDAYGVSGHGPALSYTDNGDGTFTDNNTKLMWEEKTNVSGSVHNVNNTYTWSSSGSAADGTLFTVFLNTLNNTCSDETTDCTSGGDTACTGIGNGKCGFAGYRDWRIPNPKELLSIIDYSKALPASSFPGISCGTNGFAPCYVNSATTFQGDTTKAWVVGFPYGDINANENDFKTQQHGARAVRDSGITPTPSPSPSPPPCNANLNTDINNCGACGNVCPTANNGTPICSSGICSISCNAGYVQCDGFGCINLNTDVNNCGACGHVCKQNQVCRNGICSHQ